MRAVSIVALLVVAAGCVPPPPDDPFREPPTDDVSSLLGPGELLRWRPTSFSVDGTSRAPLAWVDAWHVLYRSTTALGLPTDVSGTVLVPSAPWSGKGPRPLVTYGVGTRGLGDDCAPSHTLGVAADYESQLVLQALRRGWAVVVSDGVGLGTPGLHTYMVGRDAGPALLDAARAAQRLTPAGLDPGGPVASWGYSQGGSSAAWAAELQPTYAPELNFVGAAAGGTPADLRAVADSLDGSPFVAFLLMTALALDERYPELQLDGYLNDAGRRLVQRSGELCIVSFDGISTFASVGMTRSDRYVTDLNPLRQPEWITRLDQNRLGGDAPSAPVLLQHGLFDQIIPIDQARTLRDEWCAAGVDVTWKVHPFAEHLIGGILSVEPAVSFLRDRFGGRPPTTTCG